MEDKASGERCSLTLGQDRNVRAQRGGTMALQIGDTAPDFEAETTEGRIRFHDWIGDGWAVLFSHPKVIGLSVDPVGHHARWASDIEQTQGQAPNYPIIGDADFNGRSCTACCPPP